VAPFAYSIVRRLAVRLPVIENDRRIRHTADMGDSLEHMARSLVESGDYRVTSRLEAQAEITHQTTFPNSSPPS
jgi:hypothetical protein